jgi:hypothetical protein
MKKIILGLVLGICSISTNALAEERKGVYKLLEDKFDYPVCKEFLENLKEYENEYFMWCEIKLSDKYPQFTQVNWTEVDITQKQNKNLMNNIWESVYGKGQTLDRRMNFLNEEKYKVYSTFLENNKRTLIWLKDKECVSHSYNELAGTYWDKIYLLNEDNKTLDKSAYFASVNNDDDFNYGWLIRYNGKIFVVDASNFNWADVNKSKVDVDGRIILREINYDPRFHISDEKKCIYGWLKNN